MLRPLITNQPASRRLAFAGRDGDISATEAGPPLTLRHGRRMAGHGEFANARSQRHHPRNVTTGRPAIQSWSTGAGTRRRTAALGGVFMPADSVDPTQVAAQKARRHGVDYSGNNQSNGTQCRYASWTGSGHGAMGFILITPLALITLNNPFLLTATIVTMW